MRSPTYSKKTLFYGGFMDSKRIQKSALTVIMAVFMLASCTAAEETAIETTKPAETTLAETVDETTE
jgi:uncharacterized lipoprotein YajG